MKFSLLAFAACACLSVPALAVAQQSSVSEPAPSLQAESSNPSGEPLICKYYYYNGRVLPRRECRTAHAWERVRYVTQRNLTDFQLRALGTDR